LDRLAASGVLFEHALAQAAVTTVSHASILTGLNPFTHGLRVLHGVTENRLAASHTTLAELFQDAGYQTAAFVSAFPVTARFGLDQGFQIFDAEFMAIPEEQAIGPGGVVNTGGNQRRAGDTTDAALTWLDQTEGPFFLWVHYFDPHDTHLLPPADYLRRYPASRSDNNRVRLRAAYDIEIGYMDLQIGRLLEKLRDEGLLEQMVVVATSDHGEGLGDHDWWTHGVLYQEQIRVPLIIKAPTVPPGRQVSHLVRTIDIVPTVLELVNLDVPTPSVIEGKSLVPLFEEGATDPGYVAYADSVNVLTYSSPGGIQDIKDDMLFSVTQIPWKFIYHAGKPTDSKLYDLAQDPGESQNLFTKNRTEARRMNALLQSLDFEPEAPPDPDKMSAADRAALEALGYVSERAGGSGANEN
jgi:arylsulfatase A-like enzyme